MRKLLLIEPPTLASNHSGLYSLAALATYVENDCEVRVIDPLLEPIEKTLAKFLPDVVGVTSYTITYPESIDLMRTVRACAPEALRIIGGVHITCIPECLDDVFDAGVIGDGEEALRDIMKSGTRDSLQKISGLCYRRGEKIKINPRQAVADPRRPVPKLHKYAPAACRRGSVAFITSRGCPFRCVFCYSPVTHDKMRHYPVPWVADQFEYAVRELKAEFLMILDDTVCLDIDRLHLIADELERRSVAGFGVAVNMRSSAVTEGLCEALARLHVVSWNCGFESGSERILRRIKGPSASVEKHREMVELARKFGVTLNGSFMFGIPGETMGDMRQTLGFMDYLLQEKQKKRYKGGFWFFCATPFPGTRWWDIAERKGKVSSRMDWTILDIKSFRHHLLLDDSVTEADWKAVCAEAAGIVEKANRIF